MRRVAAILLIMAFLALGAGAVQYAHNVQHLLEPVALHDHSGSSEPAEEDHPVGCFLHSVLQAPILSAGWVPLLVCLGLFIAFLTLLSERPVAERLFERLDCRGPPALLPA